MNKISYFLLACLTLEAGLLFSMQNPAVVAIHARNKARSQNNQQQHQNQPYYTLFVMQPTPGYRTLKGCVNYLFSQNQIPAGYSMTPDNRWHISTIAIAVPFKGQPNANEVAQAREDLKAIVQRFKRSLARVSFKFNKISSIGNHKFIAAHYDFASGRIEFLNAYAKIYRDFLRKYPDAYMYYGYTAVPHISVAMTQNPGGAVPLNTSQCRRVNNVALLHGGRNLFVATGFYNPQTGRIERDKSQPI